MKKLPVFNFTPPTPHSSPSIAEPFSALEAQTTALPPVPQKDDDEIEFERNMEKLGVTQTTMPTLTSVLQYVAQLKDNTQALWLEASQRHLIQRGITQWEIMPVLTRDYMRPFWREPDSNITYERCCSRAECESMRLGQFRLRELVYPEEWAKIITSHGKWMPPLVGWCLLCHFRVTNELYFASINKLQEKRQKNGVPDQGIEEQLYRIHHFSVVADRIGEYKLSQTLCGDAHAMGLFGLFPIYNVNNYTKVRVAAGNKMLNGWSESDALVFRQAQATLERIESSPLTLGGEATHSNPSALTGSQQRTTRL